MNILIKGVLFVLCSSMALVSCSGDDEEEESKPTPAFIVNKANFPDGNFRQAVINITGVKENGEVFPETVTRINEMNVSKLGITNMKGIELFTSLEILNCSHNHLTTFDISSCPRLKVLNCSDNQLTALDISQNRFNLTELNCENNQLTTLDVSMNKNLTTLNCNNNRLTTFWAPSVKWLDCQFQTLELPLTLLPSGKHGLQLSDDAIIERISGIEGTNAIGELLIVPDEYKAIEKVDNHPFLVVYEQATQIKYRYDTSNMPMFVTITIVPK